MRLTRTKNGGVTIRVSQAEAEALHWACEGVGYDQSVFNDLKIKLATELGSDGRCGGEADART